MEMQVPERSLGRERGIQYPPARPAAPAERPCWFQSDPRPDQYATDHPQASCRTPPTERRQKYPDYPRPHSDPLPRILRVGVRPRNVPIHLERLSLKPYCRAGVINVRSRGSATLPRRASVAGRFMKKRAISRAPILVGGRLVLRRQPTQLAVGSFSQCPLLRHDTQFPPLGKLPRQRGGLSK